MKESTGHDHDHAPNRFAVVPTAVRLDADPDYTGKGVTIAFLDSGFYPHADLREPHDRILAYHDLAAERPSLSPHDTIEPWQWHGTQTSVVAAGNGAHCDGVYCGLAPDAEVILVKASTRGRITEENIARGIEWVIENRERFNIRVLNISLGGDDDVDCSRSTIDQAAEEAINQGVVVVAAAGNSGAEGMHSIPPANSPSVITVGGYDDKNDLDPATIDLYHSNFGPTADGTVKPEIIAPAMWVAAPILPGTGLYEKAEALSRLLVAPDYELGKLCRELAAKVQIPAQILSAGAAATRAFLESVLSDEKIIAAHYQHVDGTSFAAPIVTSIVAQMIEANPKLTPAAIKNILISTADRIAHASVLRQGYGVVDARQAVSLAKRDTHQWQSIVGGPPRVENGKVLFFFYGDQATSVSLAGEFNGWDSNKTKLQKDEQGMWRTALAAPPPGLYHYKFVVNGEWWLEDPNNGMKAPDNHGGLNSVLIIK
ncbi:MAG TPA: S8 family serine peptidase [Pyrinomonadaceae bacterium]|nr:S8 family serine peptidase [Pyrinomonadaceae bacterium]